MCEIRKQLLSFLFVIIGLTTTLLAQDWSKVEIQTTRLNDSLYVLMGGGGNVALLTGGNGNLLVDDGYEQLAEKMTAEIKKVNDLPIRLIINTHWHFDHVGGNEAFAEGGAIILAHEKYTRANERR